MKYTLAPGATAPTRATEGSAGYDLAAYFEGSDDFDIIVNREAVTVRTGVSVAIPNGHVGLVYMRSSLGVKGVVLANGTGVIDSDYRGEILLKLATLKYPVAIDHGERIAQLVIVPILTPELEQVQTLDETERGTGGFGSTGK